MKKRLFPLLIALSAVAVSGSAAFYSVFGLSKLFAGASTQVIIMAGSLEFAKLVVASLLYQYWDTINKWLRTYLAIACFVLILITSGGIYGFLSGAYQSTATQSELLDKSLMILNQKQVRFQETKEDLTLEKTQINKSISDLRISLSNPQQVSWYDKNSETVITSTSSSARRALQSELKTTIADRDGINIKIEAESELGPLKYLAETTGKPMNEVVNWFLLLIIFVFDPLAIALVVAANMAFAQIKKNRPVVRMSVPEGMEFNKPYTIEKKDLVMDDMEDTPREELNIDEKRMNVIGQNGNDGLHYDDIDTPLDRLTDTTQTLIVNKKDKVRVINSEKDLNDEELNELSREIGKTEIKEEIIPINPTKEELEKLAKVLNIKYSDENVELDRLTDTTQTLEHKIVKTKDSKDKNTLKYEGRK